MGFELTPNQLFTAGCLRLRNSGLAALDFFTMLLKTTVLMMTLLTLTVKVLRFHPMKSS